MYTNITDVALSATKSNNVIEITQRKLAVWV